MKSMESTSFAVLDSHQRMLDRQAAREENQARERELAQARLARRQRETTFDAVERASRRLKNANVPATISYIKGVSSVERDYYLLAEEFMGPARTTVLRQFPPARKSVRVAFLGETEDTPTNALADVESQAAPEAEVDEPVPTAEGQAEE